MALAFVCALPAVPADAVTLPAGFQQTKAIGGLVNPTDLEIAANGRVFVAEKSGIVKTYTSLADTSATVLADLRTQVHNYSNRGLLGLAVDPAFPAKPYVYVYYTLDAPIGGTPPVFGQPGRNDDACPGDLDVVNCVVSARVSRLRVSGEQMDGPEQVLVNDWCQQFAYHAGGGIEFGADGYLYVSSGEGARWGTWDYGQLGNPTNACGDPPGGRRGRDDAPGRGRRAAARPGPAHQRRPARAGGLADPHRSGDRSGRARQPARGERRRQRAAHARARVAQLRPARDPAAARNDVWLADWGGGYWEEIDRVPEPTDPIRNFGWPCYEGGLDSSGVPYARIRPRSDDQDLAICEGLYAEGSATTAPYWAYDHELHDRPGRGLRARTTAPTSRAARSGASLSTPRPARSRPPTGGALFFGDELRECIWAMLPGADGLPDRRRVVNFAQAAAESARHRARARRRPAVDRRGRVEREAHRVDG